MLLILINKSGLKCNSNDEEILDDDDEFIPQVPQTLEKKMPLMNKYFNDRSRVYQSDTVTSHSTLYSFLSQRSGIDKEKKQKNQKSDQEITSEKEEEEQSQQKINQKNEAAQEEQVEELKEQEQVIEQETSKKSTEEQVKSVEEEKVQLPEFDSYSSPQQTPQKDILASNNIFSGNHPVFDTPLVNEKPPKQKGSQTPTRLFQEQSQSDQQSVIKQRVSTESTQASAASQIFTVFQMPTQNGNQNQCGSNINSLSNTSFNSTNNDHNISQTSTKPSDMSINESYSRQEIEEVANKIKKLTVKERKQKELAILKEWNQDKNYSSHIIDISWAVQYTRWFTDPNTTVPFNIPISNMNLVDQVNKTLKQGIKEKVNFDILSSRVYFLMKCLYGGGPDIPLTRQSSSSKTINEVAKINNPYHVKQPSYGGSGDAVLTKQSSSASTAATIPSLLEQHHRNNQIKLPLCAVDTQIIAQQTSVVRPSQYFKKTHLGVRGLHNQSNYCYLNASIQCFLSIPEMNSYFLSEEFKKVVRTQSTRKALRLVPVYADMVKLYEKTPDRNILDMNLLKKTIKKPFIPHEQHDAQELIRYVLSEIQDELNPILPAKNPTEFDDPEKAYKYYLKFQNSIIDLIFSGQLTSNVLCSKCGYVSKTFDPFLDLSLGMDGKTATIQDCLNKFFSEEILSDDYKCEKCNQNNKAKKQVLISKTPYILSLHLKRFKIYPKKKKINDFIRYPLLNLSIKPYLKGGSSCGGYYYNLIGIIVHIGNSDSGHYISFVKRDNRWFCCDDGRFQEVNEKIVLKQEAYLLFYQRIEESSDTTQIKKVAQ